MSGHERPSCASRFLLLHEAKLRLGVIFNASSNKAYPKEFVCWCNHPCYCISTAETDAVQLICLIDTISLPWRSNFMQYLRDLSSLNGKLLNVPLCEQLMAGKIA